MAKIGSLSSLFILQSKSINFNFGHFWAKYQGYSLTFGQNWLIFITFHSAIKVNQFPFGHFWAKYQGYSLTFWPKLAHCHHFSFCNQSQSISILVIFGQNTKAIALLFGQNWLIVITFHSDWLWMQKWIKWWQWANFGKNQGYNCLAYIALVFCPKSMTKSVLQKPRLLTFEIAHFQNEKWWFQWANFGQKVRL